MSGATPGDVFAALLAAHEIGDYWVQTQRQSDHKGLPGAEGRKACAGHAASMTACKAVALAALYASGRRFPLRRAVFALAADAVSHYWADRRSTLAGLADLMDRNGWPGKTEFFRLGTPRPDHDDNPCLGTGAHTMDQACHIACLYLAALIAAGGT